MLDRTNGIIPEFLKAKINGDYSNFTFTLLKSPTVDENPSMLKVSLIDIGTPNSGGKYLL